jgi:hypothetical protein
MGAWVPEEPSGRPGEISSFLTGLRMIQLLSLRQNPERIDRSALEANGQEDSRSRLPKQLDPFPVQIPDTVQCFQTVRPGYDARRKSGTWPIAFQGCDSKLVRGLPTLDWTGARSVPVPRNGPLSWKPLKLPWFPESETFGGPAEVFEPDDSPVAGIQHLLGGPIRPKPSRRPAYEPPHPIRSVLTTKLSR